MPLPVEHSKTNSLPTSTLTLLTFEVTLEDKCALINFRWVEDVEDGLVKKYLTQRFIRRHLPLVKTSFVRKKVLNDRDSNPRPQKLIIWYLGLSIYFSFNLVEKLLKLRRRLLNWLRDFLPTDIFSTDRTPTRLKR